MGAAVSVRNAACARRMRLWDAAQRGDTLALRLHVRTTGERKLALNLAVRNDHLDAVCLLLSLPRQQKSALCRRDKHRSTLCRQDKHVWLNQFECDCACIMNCSWHLATPLQAAARYGSIGAVRLLCGAKATVDCDLWAHEKPLFLAAQHGHVDVLHVLLAAKATAHDPPSMFPPARGAVLHGHADALQVLLEADREIIRTNWATSCGQTLLMDAAQTGCASAVCVLLRAKACVGTRRRYDYCTAADLAADRGHQRIWRVLQIAAHDADSTQSADGTRNTNLEKALARLCDRH
jgi:ankyrin repeat protein